MPIEQDNNSKDKVSLNRYPGCQVQPYDGKMEFYVKTKDGWERK